MVNVLRKYQQTLMILVTIMVIIAFVFLYNTTKMDQLGTQFSYRVYGRKLTQTDVERVATRYPIAMRVGLTDLVFGLGGGGYDQNQAMDGFVWGSYILDHEAKRLGIVPTDEEVIAAVQALPAFQTNNAFDAEKYKLFVTNQLAPYGFTTAQFENLVRDDLRLKKLRELIGSTVDVSPAEFRTAYIQENQKLDVSLIPFTLAEFSAAVTPTEEEIKKFYEERKSTFNTEEKRVVEYVALGLTDAEKALKGKERVNALQKISDRASEFVQAMLKPGAKFTEVAKSLGLEVKTTPEMTESEGAPEFAAAPEVKAAAFKLTEADPNSDPLKFENGFYILHLGKVIPSRPLALEEARPKVAEQLQSEKGRQALATKANEIRTQIAEAIKGGKSFADAAAQAGQKVEAFPPFSIAEPSKKPNAAEITEKALELPEGGLSDFTPTATGGFILHLEKREPIDEAKLAKDQPTQIEMLKNRKRFMAFRQWLQLQRKAADVQSLVERQRGEAQ